MPGDKVTYVHARELPASFAGEVHEPRQDENVRFNVRELPYRIPGSYAKLTVKEESRSTFSGIQPHSRSGRSFDAFLTLCVPCVQKNLDL